MSPDCLGLSEAAEIVVPLRAFYPGSLEAEYNIRTGERSAVMEHDVMAQLDFPGARVDQLPAHGKARLGAVLPAVTNEWLEDLLLHGDRLDV
jgi:hypothetical protein